MAAFGAASAGAAALSLMLFIPPDARWLGLCDALSLAHVQALALGGAGLVLLAALPLPNWWARLSGLLLLGGVVAASRSEEHTSELQSLMRISYAVFCLKKKR